MPGVFAAGDVRHESVKRVASAVGEGSIAVQLVHRYFASEQFDPRRAPHDGRAGPDPLVRSAEASGGLGTDRNLHYPFRANGGSTPRLIPSRLDRSGA